MSWPGSSLHPHSLGPQLLLWGVRKELFSSSQVWEHLGRVHIKERTQGKLSLEEPALDLGASQALGGGTAASVGIVIWRRADQRESISLQEFLDLVRAHNGTLR